MAVFFTSDTHFGHAAIINLCKRPFASAEAMDETLIARWNQVVAPGDRVYHLGDMMYRSARRAGEYLDRLNGEVHLIAGNHDSSALEHDAGRFASVGLIKEITVGDHTIVLCHYPMREWNGAWRGAWHLFGHIHGRLDGEPLGHSLDVGVDSHGFRPWSMAEIEAAFANRSNPFGSGRRKANAVSKTIRAFSPPGSP